MSSDRLKMSLLPALQALLDTASVSRAADIMHVTQSTMSHTLSQLRTILNDPILVRDGNRFYLSNKARQLQSQVNKLVAEADLVFGEHRFDPLTSKQHFRMFAGSSFQEEFLLAALAKISKKAPNLTFTIETGDDESLQGLEKGESDLGFMQYYETLPAGINGTAIFRENTHIIVRKGHPLAVKGISHIAELDDYPYLCVIGPLYNDATMVSLRSLSQSLSSPWMIVDNFLAAKLALPHNDAYTVLRGDRNPSLLADTDLAFLPVPVTLPDTPFKILWPEHWDCSQAHLWLRKQLERELRQFYTDTGREHLLANDD